MAKKQIKVVVAKNGTRYAGQPVERGEEIEVDEDVARTWINLGIAQRPGGSGSKEPVVDDDTKDDDTKDAKKGADDMGNDQTADEKKTGQTTPATGSNEQTADEKKAGSTPEHQAGGSEAKKGK